MTVIALKAVDQNEPVEDVVEVLRGLLERAERGEVRGVACAYSLGAFTVGSQMAWGDGERFNVAAAVLALSARVGNRMLEDSD